MIALILTTLSCRQGYQPGRQLHQRGPGVEPVQERPVHNATDHEETSTKQLAETKQPTGGRRIPSGRQQFQRQQQQQQ